MDPSDLPPPKGFDAFVGTEFLSIDPDDARARIPVAEQVLQPFGLVHGGVYSALAESLASISTAVAVHPEGKTGVGLANHASFMRPITAGHIHASGRARHRGSTTWVWEIDVTDDQARLCAMVRVTIAVRPLPER